MDFDLMKPYPRPRWRLIASPTAMSDSYMESLESLRESLLASSYIEGLTHGFYHYPARFSPAVARTVIEQFSNRNDWILDPFMGGGTAIVEGLALGRRMVGIDINPLAHFVATTRTTPLSDNDEEEIRGWVSRAERLLAGPYVDMISPMGVYNMPDALDRFMSAALSLVDGLPMRRQQSFARCVLLRLGQWALDGREWRTPRRGRLASQLSELADGMLAGMRELVEACANVGVPKSALRSRRVLLKASATELHSLPALEALDRRPRLVFTSPPYPGVHVLYHRWQYRGRKETPAPYRIAAVQDGQPESYYTAGGRTPVGIDRYFVKIEAAFRAVHEVTSRGVVVVQLVGFSDPETQVARYESAMEAAGFEPWALPDGSTLRLSRIVHNRKWYHRVRQGRAGGSELLLVHRRA
jgi:DNA modification methylase